MLRYFKPVSKTDTLQLLPKPASKDLQDKGLDPASIRSANEEILKQVEGEDPLNQTPGSTLSAASSASGGKVKPKRGPYGVYSSQLRAKIGRYAAENSVVAAARKFSQDIGSPLNESTVRGMKKAYLSKMQEAGPEPIDELARHFRGRPVLLGKETDLKVQRFIRALRESGGPVSTPLVMAATKGLLKNETPPILSDFGGPVVLEKTWARSLLQRMHFTKRKGTKAARKLPADLEVVREKFQRRIGRRVRKYGIPDELIINWDQTAVEVIPCGNWTMNHRGDNQVEIRGVDDKRQYTALLACTMSGEMLPPQIIYQGTTERCHPNTNFPRDWDVWHSASHWSTSATMVRYIERIIVPYVRRTQERLNTNARPLLIFDVFAAHRTEDVRRAITEEGGLCVFIPPSCTGEMQPLDATVNAKYKQVMRNQFQMWFAEKVSSMVQEGLGADDIAARTDLRTATIKPIHAQWLIRTQEIISNEVEVMKEGFRKTGIVQAVYDARAGPVPRRDDSDAELDEWDDD